MYPVAAIPFTTIFYEWTIILYPFFYLHFTPSILKPLQAYQTISRSQFPTFILRPPVPASPSHLRLAIPRRRLRLARPPSRPVACSTAFIHHLPPVCFTALLDLFEFVREMDSKEQSEKLKNYEAQYANYLKAKYFSDKDIYGGNIFEEKTTIGGMTIRASSEAGTRSYEDPVGYWNEKYAPRIEPSTETTTATNLSNGNHSSKKSA
ncbi:unnamed protein product [Lactuca saligna]|uniref:Uncharacterized protein n=1 Tax=Lactuca saligna TaxID=75948 RepID=A0AA35V4K5_LACSI|nr:unnamed protein product [Lactuca saligna]